MLGLRGEANKRRLFLALYPAIAVDNGVAHEPYHWALLLSPKDYHKDGSEGRMYHVADTGEQSPQPVPWHYEETSEDERPVCRLQLGKVKETDIARLKGTLTDLVHFCQDRSEEFSCKVWCRRAVEALQEAGMVQSTAVLDGESIEWEVQGLARDVEKSRQWGKVEVYKGTGKWGFVC